MFSNASMPWNHETSEKHSVSQPFYHFAHLDLLSSLILSVQIFSLMTLSSLIFCLLTILALTGCTDLPSSFSMSDV